MSDMDDRTEFQGGGVMPNGVFPKGKEALTPSDKLRLMSTTGQTEDPNAKVDPGFWYGNEYFDLNARPEVDQNRVRRERQNRRAEGRRYRETPR